MCKHPPGRGTGTQVYRCFERVCPVPGNPLHFRFKCCGEQGCRYCTAGSRWLEAVLAASQAPLEIQALKRSLQTPKCVPVALQTSGAAPQLVVRTAREAFDVSNLDGRLEAAAWLLLQGP